MKLLERLLVQSRRAKGVLFDVTSFTQSLGSELLTNPGDVFGFTLDDPTSWTISGEVLLDPAVHQVGVGDDHLGIGLGYVNLYSSLTNQQPRMQQSVLSVGTIYELALVIDTVTSGELILLDASSGISKTFTTAGAKIVMGRAANAALQLRGGTAATDVTVKSISAKAVTLNAVRTAAVNTDIRAAFTLPGSPVVGQRIELWYRLPAGEPYNDGWVAYLEYNGSEWQFILDRYSSAVHTEVIAAVNAGTPNVLRVMTNGNQHIGFTGVAGINGGYTQRGATQTNATHNTAVQSLLLYSSGITGNKQHRAI